MAQPSSVCRIGCRIPRQILPVFLRHKGTYIRLAHADSLTGPWSLYTPGALDLEESLFVADDPPEPPETDRPAWAKGMKGGYLYAHIASPDVHIDDVTRCFRMYYHGLLWNGDQQTRLATSTDGISFQPLDPLLGPPYFRAFTYCGFVYVITWGGEVWRARQWEGPFESGPRLVHYDAKGGIGEGFRHGEVHRVGDTLYVFYTRMGDRPERILYAEINLKSDWKTWIAGDSKVLLEPELEWEGVDLPLETSTMGAVHQRARETTGSVRVPGRRRQDLSALLRRGRKWHRPGSPLRAMILYLKYFVWQRLLVQLSWAHPDARNLTGTESRVANSSSGR